MGFYTNASGIACFEPDNTETTVYLPYSTDLESLLDVAKESFGYDVDIATIMVSTEQIHTSCIGYDMYDSSDWTTYTVLTIL